MLLRSSIISKRVIIKNLLLIHKHGHFNYLNISSLCYLSDETNTYSSRIAAVQKCFQHPQHVYKACKANTSATNSAACNKHTSRILEIFFK